METAKRLITGRAALAGMAALLLFMTGCEDKDASLRQEMIAKNESFKSKKNAGVIYRFVFYGNDVVTANRDEYSSGRYVEHFSFVPHYLWSEGERRKGICSSLSDREGFFTTYLRQRSILPNSVMRKGDITLAGEYVVFRYTTRQFLFPTIYFQRYTYEWGLNKETGRRDWRRTYVGSKVSELIYYSQHEKPGMDHFSLEDRLRLFKTQKELVAALRKYILLNPPLLVAAPELKNSLE